MKVIKFGGSSLADAKQIRKICSIILSDSQRRIVVVSAPGKRHNDDTKVTDLLIHLAETCRDGGDTATRLGIGSGTVCRNCERSKSWKRDCSDDQKRSRF